MREGLAMGADSDDVFATAGATVISPILGLVIVLAIANLKLIFI
jgi:hypothetical protein